MPYHPIRPNINLNLMRIAQPCRPTKRSDKNEQKNENMKPILQKETKRLAENPPNQPNTHKKGIQSTLPTNLTNCFPLMNAIRECDAICCTSRFTIRGYISICDGKT